VYSVNVLIGHLDLGKTDSFDYQCVKTRFFCIGLPLDAMDVDEIAPPV
jgi:hypothetical protein